MSEEEAFVDDIPFHATEDNISVKINLGVMVLRLANTSSVSGVCQYDITAEDGWKILA